MWPLAQMIAVLMPHVRCVADLTCVRSNQYHTMIDTSDRSRNADIEEKKRYIWQGIDE